MLRESLRIFVVDGRGVASIFEASPELDAAMDIMLDDRVPLDQAAELLGACLRSGRNPEHFARHFVKLRRAARGG